MHALRRVTSAAAAVGGDALVGQPHAAGKRARLPEHVDRHAAARVPVAADAQELRLQQSDEALADGQRAVLVEGTVVAERAEVELQRLGSPPASRAARSR